MTTSGFIAVQNFVKIIVAVSIICKFEYVEYVARLD